MRIGITVWDGTVANTCDFAKELLISDPDAENRIIPVPHLPDPRSLASWFEVEGVQRLVCGALSWRLEEELTARGIEVVPFVMGDAREVLAACRSGSLDAAYHMPGRRRRCRRPGGRCDRSRP